MGFIWQVQENLKFVRKNESYSKSFYRWLGIFFLLASGIIVFVADYEGRNWHDLFGVNEFTAILVAAIFFMLMGLLARKRVYQLLVARPNSVKEVWVEHRSVVPIIGYPIIYIHVVDQKGKRLGMFVRPKLLPPILDEIKAIAPQAAFNKGVVRAEKGFRSFLDKINANPFDAKLRILFVFVLILVSFFLGIISILHVGSERLLPMPVWMGLWMALQSFILFLCVKILKALRKKRFGDNPPEDFDCTFAFVYSYFFAVAVAILAKYSVFKVAWGAWEAKHWGMAVGAFALLAIIIRWAYCYVTKPPAIEN